MDDDFQVTHVRLKSFLYRHLKIECAKKGISQQMAMEQAIEEWIKTSIGYYRDGKNEDKRPRS